MHIWVIDTNPDSKTSSAKKQNRGKYYKSLKAERRWEYIKDCYGHPGSIRSLVSADSIRMHLLFDLNGRERHFDRIEAFRLDPCRSSYTPFANWRLSDSFTAQWASIDRRSPIRHAESQLVAWSESFGAAFSLDSHALSDQPGLTFVQLIRMYCLCCFSVLFRSLLSTN